jgi:hypothetical protein
MQFILPSRHVKTIRQRNYRIFLWVAWTVVICTLLVLNCPNSLCTTRGGNHIDSLLASSQATTNGDSAAGQLPSSSVTILEDEIVKTWTSTDSQPQSSIVGGGNGPKSTTTTTTNNVRRSYKRSITSITEEVYPLPITNQLSSKTTLNQFFAQLPLLNFPEHVNLTYQMHNCWHGQWGTKRGLENAGFYIVEQQQHPRADGSYPTLRIFDDVVAMVPCNAIHATRTMSHDKRVTNKRLVANIVGVLSHYCLGNGKLVQMKCRRELAEAHGCNFEKLSVQPATFMLSKLEEVDALRQLPSRPWLVKRNIGSSGHGMKLFHNTQALMDAIYEPDSEYITSGMYLAQEYIAKPALLSSKYKFDIRTWLLVLSIEPLIVFAHDGFGRVARVPYAVNSSSLFAHITNINGQGRGRGRRRQLVEKQQVHHRQLYAGETDNEIITDDDSNNENENDDRAGDRDDEARTPESGVYLRNFTTIGQQLYESNLGFPPNYMETGFREQIDHAHVIAALAQFRRSPRATVKVNCRIFSYVCL